MTSTSHFLDDETYIELDELGRASGLDTTRIIELTEFGVFEPRRDTGRWRYSTRCILRARQAARLQRDFELDATGVALALTYLDRIEALERRLRELECQLLR